MRRCKRTIANYVVIAAAMFGWTGQAQAQSVTTQVFQTTIPFSYDRGRNESVTDRARPEYDPTGLEIGAFNVSPSLALSGGYTDNVYQASTVRASSAFAVVRPNVSIASNWAVHSLRLDASGNFVRHTAVPSRDENGWSTGGIGTISLSSNKTVSLAARTSRLFETPFSGGGVPISRTALPIQSTLFSGLADFKFTRVRLALAADHSILNFLPATTFAGAPLNRDTSDRNISRVTGHVEYGLTPDAGVFLQSTYTRTRYPVAFSPTVANRQSSEFKILAGTSFDLTALLRGSVAVGYIKRNYESPLYSDIKGFSVGGKLEYFPSQLTTVTLVLRRDIEDSTLVNSGGYFNNGISARVDHEFLRNLIANIGADYEHDSYRGFTATSDIYRFSTGASYLVNRLISLNGNIGYRKRTSNSAVIGPPIPEFRGMIGVTFKR